MKNHALNIGVLGDLWAEQDGRVISRFRLKKAAALLAYLALYRHRPHSREELAERFWPDTDPEAGRRSLRVALVSLRRQLEQPQPGAASDSGLC
jgi:DNA-binding SARP family transcriptional activator